ncbi:MAG: VWA domain-containing protein, partial [Planctomycetia bacterium]|nr:VWA domain-containing protein [Planctomycetia bacterium]
MFAQVATAAAPPNSQATRLDSYVNSEGKGYFALAMSPKIDKTPHDAAIVVLVDTSASQAGEYRTQAMATLQTMLNSLTPGDSVKLIAVDLDATPMTDQFVSPKGDAIQQAIGKLERRVPLGSTDMVRAMSVAADCFATGSTNRRAVIYIGDGMSTANIVGSAKFGDIVMKLTGRHVPVTSFAVGPQVDAELLSILANQTGGMVLLDHAGRDIAMTGKALADVARGPVVWPTQANYPASFETV